MDPGGLRTVPKSLRASLRHRLLLPALALAPALAVQAQEVSSPPSAASPRTAEERAEIIARIGPPFTACDGYGQPTSSGDGMTTYASNWGMFIGTGDRRRSVGSLGANGLIACDLALEELQSRPGYWMRRTSLLRARALHHIAAGDLTAASADLDAAQAAAADPNDLYFKRSIKLGMDLTRAFIARRSGNQPGADQLALAVSDSRPFSRETSIAALETIGAEAAFPTREALLRRIAQLDPNFTGVLFEQAFEAMEYAKVVELYPGLQPPVKFPDEPIQERNRLQIEQDNRAEAEMFWTLATLEKAYALAALGRNAESRAALAEAKTRVAAAISAPAPPAPPEGEQPKLRDVVTEQTNLKIRTNLPPVLDRWTALTEARLLTSEGKLAEAGVRFQQVGKLPPSYAVIDLMGALGAKLPEGSRPDVARWRAELKSVQTTPSPEAELLALARRMPEAETAKRSPTKKTWGLFSNECKADSKAAGVDVTLKCWNTETTQAMAEEAAILRGAELAQQNGKGAMVIHSAHDIQHTMVNTMYSVPMASFPAGYEAVIQVVYENASVAAAPAWRRIDVAAAVGSLSPIYRSAGQRPGGDRP
jgi:hypothetical protein